jgi:hypothetical protein
MLIDILSIKEKRRQRNEIIGTNTNNNNNVKNLRRVEVK